MGTEPGVGVPESATFAQALNTLKRKGSNILLVGSTDSDSHKSACDRLLGASSDDSRYRIFVVTDEANCCAPVEYGGESDDQTSYIVQIPTDADANADRYRADAVTVTKMLGVLGTEFVETVNEHEAEAGGFDPSELRVCVDSVSQLLDSHQSENVFRLLHVLTTRIKQANGMGHYHLPVDRDHDAVRLLEPLFDAVVEIRSDTGTHEHRWHLRDRDTSSDWISL